MLPTHSRLAAVVVIAVAAVVVAGCSSSPLPPAPAPTAPPLRGEVASGPRSVEHRVPVGWSRDAEGARAAAVSAVGLTGELVGAGFITRGDMIGVLASQRYAPTLTADSAGQLREMLGELADDGVTAAAVLWRELPLTAEIVRIDDAAAVVRVWAVLVVGAPGRGTPRQVWRTVTVSLVWERGDWRVDGWDAAAGPTPALANNAPIATLDELAAVTAWPTASVGG